MPPRWPRKPDRNDPAFRRLDDRMTFATHVALFAATNSGVWFFREIQAQSWNWATWLTGLWAIALVLHGVYIFAIANYTEATSVTSNRSSKSS
jgi:hypothetical protein